MNANRIEHDLIGTKEIPKEAYYGIHSIRAKENFRISGRRVHPELIIALAQVKKAAAITNFKTGALNRDLSNAICQACDEIIAGGLKDSFIVDAIQGGAGTSLNMNANEVIANRAIEILGGEKGDYSVVHPLDHVNRSQSTNDVYPSAGKIVIFKLLKKAIIELRSLRDGFDEKSNTYKNVAKIGRTEMQDAVPISFEQSFKAYSSAISRDIKRLELAIDEISFLNLGATAIGTGITASKEYIENIVPTLNEITGENFKQADDLVDATQNLDCYVMVSGSIKAAAVTLSKIANDLRLMSSGPRCGFGEINLPAKQNGSSIMPGKVNPVIPEVVNQIAFNIIGNDTTVTLASEAGQLELNAFAPIIFDRLFESIETLSNGAAVFYKDCIKDITVNEERCREEVERSIGTVTALTSEIGYDRATKYARLALSENRNVKDILIEEGLFHAEEFGSPNDLVTNI